MRYKQYKVYTICLYFLVSQNALAQKTTSNASAEAPAAIAVQINKTTQATPVQSGTIAKPRNEVPESSINGAANQSKSKNMLASQVSTIVGGGLMIAGMTWLNAANSCNPACTWKYGVAAGLFTAGILALQQASHNNKSAQGSSGAASSTASKVGWDNIGENVGADPLADPAIRSMIDVNKVKEGISQAKKMGIDGKNPVKIGGKEHNPSDFSSPQAMAAAGLSPDMIKSVMSTATKLEKEAIKRLGAHTATMGYEEGGGSATASSATSNYNTDSGPAYPGAGRVPRDPASISVAGLTKNFNGDPIGVAADSIFQMMTRRYKLKEKQNSFIEGSAANLQK